MKNSVKYLLVSFAIIAFSGSAYYFFSRCIGGNKVSVKSEKVVTYSKGEEKKEFKKGIETEKVKIKSDHKVASAKVKKDSLKDSNSTIVPFSFTGNDSVNYKLDLNVITYPGCDSIKVGYNLQFDEITKGRIDTVFISRVDTSKEVTKETQKDDTPQPFYKTFWFGAASALGVVLGVVFIAK